MLKTMNRRQAITATTALAAVTIPLGGSQASVSSRPEAVSEELKALLESFYAAKEACRVSWERVNELSLRGELTGELEDAMTMHQQEARWAAYDDLMWYEVRNGVELAEKVKAVIVENDGNVGAIGEAQLDLPCMIRDMLRLGGQESDASVKAYLDSLRAGTI